MVYSVVSVHSFASIVREPNARAGGQENRGDFCRKHPPRHEGGGSGQVPPRQGITAFTTLANNADGSTHPAVPGGEKREHLRVRDATLAGDRGCTAALQRPCLRRQGSQGKATEGKLSEADGNCAGVQVRGVPALCGVAAGGADMPVGGDVGGDVSGI